MHCDFKMKPLLSKMSICAKSHGPLYLQDHEVSYKTRTELARDCHDKNEKLQNMKLQCAQTK